MLKMQFYLSKSIILITNKNDDFNLTFVKGGYENVLCCCWSTFWWVLIRTIVCSLSWGCFYCCGKVTWGVSVWRWRSITNRMRSWSCGRQDYARKRRIYRQRWRNWSARETFTYANSNAYTMRTTLGEAAGLFVVWNIYLFYNLAFLICILINLYHLFYDEWMEKWVLISHV